MFTSLGVLFADCLPLGPLIYFAFSHDLDPLCCFFLYRALCDILARELFRNQFGCCDVSVHSLCLQLALNLKAFISCCMLMSGHPVVSQILVVVESFLFLIVIK